MEKRDKREKRYYSDGITSHTDPFWTVKCKCGYSGWALTYTTTCHKCGSKEIECTNPLIKKP